MVKSKMKKPRGRLMRILLREIWKTRTRFLSLFLMTLISATMFAGVYAITPTMQSNVNQMYDAQQVYDISIRNNNGWSQSQLDHLRMSFPDIELLDIRNTVDVNVQIEDTTYATRIVSPSEMNLSHITAGRSIQKENECLIDNGFENQIGKDVVFYNGTQKQQCHVVGTIHAAEFFSKENKGRTNLRNGKIQMSMMMAPENFTFENNELLIRLKELREYSMFSPEYETKVKTYSQRLEHLYHESDVQVQTRLDLDSVKAYKEDSEKINEIGTIFPIIFIVVSMLVVITTMTRMIDDDRNMIGTLKSLGYRKASLLFYYQGYVFIPAFLGSIVGSIIGIQLFPRIVMQSYQSLYTVLNIGVVTNLLLDGIVFIILIGSLTGVTFLTVLSTLSEKPSELLRPKAPLAGKKILLERVTFIWRRMKFVDKVTIRNIFRYKKRLLMSLFGIAGSTAILLTAFGLYTSITPTVNRQFDEIQTYDYTLFHQGYIQNEEKYAGEIKDLEHVNRTLPALQQNVKIKANEKIDDVTMIIPKKTSEMFHFFQFSDAQKFYVDRNKKLDFQSTAVILTQKIARIYGVHVGDNIGLLLNDKSYTFNVTGITENYFGNNIYIAPEIFSQVINDTVRFNSLLVKCEDGKQQYSNDIVDDILSVDPQIAIVENQTNKSIAKQSVSSVNSIVILMIVFAVLLIMIVIYNLNSINIAERTRELATIKVLGFYNRELLSYVFKESLITTMIASLLGLIAGIPIHLFIVMQAEIASLQFIYMIPVIVYVITFLGTNLISILTMVFMLRKIYKIDMISSLKSVE
ncbi:MAG: FtsX-like permease family protein [Culicoidibacterales bacterium]